MNNGNNGTAPAQPQQPPTIEQLITEGHARIRRMNADQVYLGSLLDTLYQEIVRREKTITELREPLTNVAAPETARP